MEHVHENQPVLHAGLPLAKAKATMIAIHGRGASAESILQLPLSLNVDGFGYLAPQARGSSWYPQSFLAPIEQNEPGLSSALNTLDALVGKVQNAGVPTEKLILLGFSQGACLVTEFVARNPRRFGGVVALSGGLIGPPGTPREYPGELKQTPVFLGCSDVDFHIPLERVRESTRTLSTLGGRVDERIYPGMGHTVNDDELAVVRQMMQDVIT